MPETAAHPATAPAPWEEAPPGLEQRVLPDAAEPEAGWPAPLDDAALHGLAGEAVRRLLPRTEADPAGLLLTLLAAAGNMAGGGIGWEVSGARHGLRVWPVLVGRTARGRKGTTWGTISPVLKIADPEWFAERVSGGLSSGEGLIAALRDRDPDPDADRAAASARPPEPPDRRLFVLEEEFGGTLAVANRRGSSLTAVVRKAYDGGTLRTLTRMDPLAASDPHVTILGHTSAEEMRANLRGTDIANGFANRFLFACVRRSKLLPHGGPLPEDAVRELGRSLAGALRAVPTDHSYRRDRDAAARWEELYPELTHERLGLAGAVTSRAEVQVMRLACIYALLDADILVRPAHLEAAAAVWRYCAASVFWLFVDRTGNPLADRILAALHDGPITKTQLWDRFGRNVTAEELREAITPLISSRRITVEINETGKPGRPPAVMYLNEDRSSTAFQR